MRFELYRSMTMRLRREWRWRLLASNNRIIAISGESYVNFADCTAAIRLVQSSDKVLTLTL